MTRNKCYRDILELVSIVYPTLFITHSIFFYFFISDCGVRPIREGRIVGGRETAFGDWPWQVLVKESTLLGSRANQI